LPRPIYIGLLHHPVLDQQGRIINTAVTNLDVHDLARLARTYDLAGSYVVQPLELQSRLVRRTIAYWTEGGGGRYNHTRQEAFTRVRLTRTLDEAVAEIAAETGQRPRVIATSARPQADALAYARVRAELAQGGVWLIVFGTGWGLAPECLAGMDGVLAPIEPGSDYNHLSVRMAAAIVVDRLLGGREETGG
jgi:hypothetical protein